MGLEALLLVALHDVIYTSARVSRVTQPGFF